MELSILLRYMNIGIDVFAIVNLLILYITSRHAFDNSQDVRYLHGTMGRLLVILITDTISWVCGGTPGTFMHYFLYVDLMIYMVLQLDAVLAWRRYVHYRVNGRKMTVRMELLSSWLPLSVLLLLMLSTPFTGLMFTVDSENVYARGPLNSPMAIVVMIYLALTSLWVLRKRQGEQRTDKRAEYLVLAAFVVPPFIGGIIQVCVYGVSLIWPCAYISMLLLYLNLSQQEISMDALTELNNRGSLDQYLLDLINERIDHYLIIIDVDRFKQINDNFGHDVGDMALKDMSQILRENFVGHKEYIARYGGDEFVVVFPNGTTMQIREMLNNLNERIEDYNKSAGKPYNLEISAGFAQYRWDIMDGPEDIIKLADARMYEMKEEHHKLH